MLQVNLGQQQPDLGQHQPPEGAADSPADSLGNPLLTVNVAVGLSWTGCMPTGFPLHSAHKKITYDDEWRMQIVFATSSCNLENIYVTVHAKTRNTDQTLLRKMRFYLNWKV